MIAKQNNFLKNVINCPMDSEQTRAQYMAESKCLRAYFLFYLAFHYKDVPMPLTTLTREEANSISQTPQQDVYDQVESDLLESIDVLPDSYDASSYGREKLFWIGGEYSPETIFCVMGLEDKFTTARYQYQYPECAYGGWHQFAVYNELVKEYFCTDGKGIETSEV